MQIEVAIVAIALCLGLVPLLVVAGRVHVGRRVATGSMVLLWSILPIALVVMAINSRRPIITDPEVEYRPVEDPVQGYVGSQTCRACHPHEHATWHASYHRSMTQVANAETVIGDFADVELRDRGFVFRLSRDGDQLFADFEEPGLAELNGHGPRINPQIVMTTGSHHMQLYWYTMGNESRALGLFPFAYLCEERQWVPRDSVFLQPKPPRPLGEFARWNTECIRCHATGGRPRLEASGRMDTRVAEFGIACEACHGPGEEHARANRQPLRRYALHVTNGVDDTIVNPARLSAKRSAQVCGQCHGFWRDNAAGQNEQFLVDGDPFRPGDDLNAYATLERYDDAAQDETPHKMPHLGDYQEIDVNFWSDGMVRAGGREYNELVNAACHLRGELTCLSCHRMHQSTNDPRSLDQWKDDQMKLGHKGDLACTQCHVEFEDAQSVASHTHHDRNSGGSRCLNCHMPYTTYALLKAIRSHQISVPNVQSSLATGRPNACNQCHLDQTMAWTAEHLTAWYGTPEADIPKDERDVAASVVWLLKGDAGQRALMAWSLGWDEAQEASGTHWMPRYLAELIEDPYDAVRLIAFRALQQFPGFEDLKFDFDQSDQETAAIRVDVIRRWSQQNSSPSRQGAARLLLDPDGRVMHKELQRLLEQRDLRPIRLPE